MQFPPIRQKWILYVEQKKISWLYSAFICINLRNYTSTLVCCIIGECSSHQVLTDRYVKRYFNQFNQLGGKGSRLLPWSFESCRRAWIVICNATNSAVVVFLSCSAWISEISMFLYISMYDKVLYDVEVFSLYKTPKPYLWSFNDSFLYVLWQVLTFSKGNFL